MSAGRGMGATVWACWRMRRNFAAVADDPIPLAKFVSVKLVFPAQVPNLGAQLGVFPECPVHAVEFFDAEFDFVFQVKIFFDEVRRAQAQRGHSRIYGALPGQHDDGQIRHCGEHARQNFEAIGFVRPEVEVEDREADAVRMLFEIGQRLAGGRKCPHPARIALAGFRSACRGLRSGRRQR